MKVTILGAGAYALALSKVIYENTKDITIWSAVSDEVALLNKERSNKKALDYKLPDEIKITDNLKDAVKNSDVIVIAVACKFISNVCHNLKKYILSWFFLKTCLHFLPETCISSATSRFFPVPNSKCLKPHFSIKSKSYLLDISSWRCLF